MKSLPRLALFCLALFAFAAACMPSRPAGPDSLVVGKGGDAGAQDQAAAKAPQSEEDAAIPISVGDPAKGSRLAAVTLVVFSDFQCPYCARLAPTLDKLFGEYGADKLRIVFKHQPLPMHPQARLAAEVAVGVIELGGSDAFWRYHNIAFDKQKDISPEAIYAWAAAAGVDERAIRDGIASHRWAGKVDRDMHLARTHGVNGTPSMFIDGIEIVGARPAEDLEAVIDGELEASKKLAASGIAKDAIYTQLTNDNYKASADRLAQEKAKREAEEKQHAADELAAQQIVHKIPVGSAPTRGPATALVTIIEFSDFQCPYCKRAEPTLDKLRQAYGDKIRIVWRDYPLSFHERAEPAAELARYARSVKGDAGFWEVHDALYTSQPHLEDSDLEKIAEGAKLDKAKAMAAVKGKAFAAGLESDDLAADDFEVQGTPNFFINGHHLIGAKDLETFKSFIDPEIAKAEALLKSGTPKTAIYDAIIKDGAPPLEPEKRGLAPPAADAPYFGTPTAKIVIQEFADFQCPFCGKVSSTMDDLLKAFPGKIKLVWRDNPLAFHPDAELAAEAAREAQKQKGNAGFQQMHKLLFANQKALKRTDLEGYAQQMGLDMAKFDAALDAHAHKATIDADVKAATEAGAMGTPSFWVGPYYQSGAQSLSKFKRLVTRALALPADKLQPGPPSKPSAVASAPPTVKTPPTNPPAVTTLKIEDLQGGRGRTVAQGDKVKVHYVGRLMDGTEFDASRKYGNEPFKFKVGAGQVIKGWDQGLIGMKVGGKRKLTIPPDLAYGDRGAGSAIPPKATLVFEIELVDIE